MNGSHQFNKIAFFLKISKIILFFPPYPRSPNHPFRHGADIERGLLEI